MRIFPIFLVLSTSFLFTSIATWRLIPLLQRKKLGQTILSIGPTWHKSKEGTPTMGGVVFLFSIPLVTLIGILCTDKVLDPRLVYVLLFALANGFIGLIDDGTKLKNKRNLGLLPWQKLFLQSFFVGAFLFLVTTNGGEALVLTLPFSSLSKSADIILLFFLFVLMLGITNCVNLSDGIDGLTSASSAVIGLFFVIEGYRTDESSLTAIGAALLGTMLGFLLFNAHPAKIFMGDTGSLFLGGLLAGTAYLTENPAILPVYAFLFLLEGFSVILQVLVFKRTGKRLFRMAPLHHHLEKSGWSEWRIVGVFSFITLLSCVFAHFALIWR